MSRNRTYIVLALAVCLLFAGCAGLSGTQSTPAQSEETTTPVSEVENNSTEMQNMTSTPTESPTTPTKNVTESPTNGDDTTTAPSQPTSETKVVDGIELDVEKNADSASKEVEEDTPSPTPESEVDEVAPSVDTSETPQTTTTTTEVPESEPTPVITTESDSGPQPKPEPERTVENETGENTSTPSKTETPESTSPDSTETPGQDTQSESKVDIVLIQPASSESSYEHIKIQNTGEKEIDMEGWKVADDEGHSYTIGANTTLESSETVTIYTGNGTDTESSKYWSDESNVWNENGDTITITNADGDVVYEDVYQSY